LKDTIEDSPTKPLIVSYYR